MSKEEPPPTCCKCLEPVGSDAVFLKNGTYMCPACYQRYYGKTGEPGRSKNVFVSVEGVIAIVAVIGLFVLGYFIYSYVENSRREERIAAKLAEEKAEKLRLDDIAANDVRIRKAEEAHKADMERQERIQKERLQAAAIADAKRMEELKLAKAESERKRVEEEKRLAEMREKQQREAAARAKAGNNSASADALKDTADAAKARTMELGMLARTLADAQKSIASAGTLKTDLARRSVAYKGLMRSAQDTKSNLLAQYNASVTRDRAEDVNDISQWRDGSSVQTKNFTGSSVTTVSREDLMKLVLKFDNATRTIQTNEASLNAVNEDLAKAETAIADAKGKIEDSNRRLLELKATPAELAALGANPNAPATVDNTGNPGPGPVAPKPGTKIIQKKDGSQIRALSVMSMGDEVRYKDEEGKWQTMKKDEVEKIQ